jgi:DNA ligase (NAD+)
MNYLQKSKEFLEKNIKNFTIEDTKILQKLIGYHSDLYYNKENPIISDYEYDQLFKKLEILEEKFNLEKKQTLEV